MNTVSLSKDCFERLVKAEQMLKHLLTHCTYLEDGREHDQRDCWSQDDNDRECLSLAEYLELRVRGIHVPDKWSAELTLEEAQRMEERKAA